MMAEQASEDQCLSTNKQHRSAKKVEAIRAARKRAEQKARNMLADIQKDEKARQPTSLKPAHHSDHGVRRGRAMVRSSSAEYG